MIYIINSLVCKPPAMYIQLKLTKEEVCTNSMANRVLISTLVANTRDRFVGKEYFVNNTMVINSQFTVVEDITFEEFEGKQSREETKEIEAFAKEH